MKKKLIIGVGLLLVILAWLVLFFVPQQMVGLITDYEPYRFESILDYDSMRLDYGIGEHKEPADYGYTDVTEFDFYSTYDSVRCNGWYVNSAPNSTKCIALIHGRTSNRLKPLKYLALFKETGLDTIYNFFIPDLRNSGKADASKTYLGYRFAEDLTSGLSVVQQNYGQSSFILYGFSMGAMATETMLAREALMQHLKNVRIEKIVLDSPLSNIWVGVKDGADEMGVPAFITDRAFAVFNEDIDCFADKMEFSYLLQKNSIPTLILASRADTTTPYETLVAELDGLDRSNVHLETFEAVRHVRIYQTDSLQDRYTQSVNLFIRGEK